MEIHYETYGIPHDCEKKRITVSSVSNNYVHSNIHVIITTYL